MNGKVLTMRNDKTVWGPAPKEGGPIDPKRLPEGYPYKEQSETVIEFDGNTEGHAMAGARYCKVSDIAFDDLAGCKVTYYDASLAGMLGTDRIDGELSYAGAEGDLHGYTITLSFEGENMPIAAVGVVPEGSTMFESGTYFFVGANGGYTESLTAMTETIHPMTPEFLPAGVGGGGAMVVHITGSSAPYTADKGPDEIATAVAEGKAVYAVLTDDTANWVCPLLVYNPMGKTGAVFVSFATMEEGVGVIKQITVLDASYVVISDYNISITQV